jgi:hypothetical protein
MDLPNLQVTPPFAFDVALLESDGVHLNAVTGAAFLKFISLSIQGTLGGAKTAAATLADTDTATPADTDADATLVVINSGDEDDGEAEDDLESVVTSESDSASESDRLGAILKIVQGNSKLLKTVRPLKDSFTMLVQRADSIETQVRARRQKDNLVFARIKEETDYDLNKAREDRVVISGLERFGSGLSTHVEKKEHYKKLVSDLVALACPDVNPAPEVLDVLVNLRREQLHPVVEAKFDTPSNASVFRRAAASLAKAKHLRFAKLFFSNSVTQATRVRIEIMRAIAKKLATESESAYVQGFVSKPVLHYIVKENMASEASGTGRSYSFVDSVSRFGDLLMPVDLAPAYKRAGSTFNGAMEHYFVLLKDDFDASCFVVPSVNRVPLGHRGAFSGRRGSPLLRRFGRGSPLLRRSGRGSPITPAPGRKRTPDSISETPSKRKTNAP